MTFTVRIHNKACATMFAFVSVIRDGQVVAAKMPPTTAGLLPRLEDTDGNLVVPGKMRRTVSISANDDDVVLLQMFTSNDASSATQVKSVRKVVDSKSTEWAVSVGGVYDQGMYIAAVVIVAIFLALLLAIMIMLVRSAIKNGDGSDQ